MPALLPGSCSNAARELIEYRPCSCLAATDGVAALRLTFPTPVGACRVLSDCSLTLRRTLTPFSASWGDYGGDRVSRLTGIRKQSESAPALNSGSRSNVGRSLIEYRPCSCLAAAGGVAALRLIFPALVLLLLTCALQS